MTEQIKKENTKEEVKKEVKQETAEVSTPKLRRGLGSARGAARLKFNEKDAQSNGLFLAHLESVEVTEVSFGETSSPSFAGMSVPRLNLTFASNEAEANKRKYVTQTFFPVESNADNIPGGKDDWKVNQIFDYLKHILNVYYLKGREFTEEEEEQLSLAYVDFDEQGGYIPTEPEEVVAAWKALFDNFATIMNTANDGKPVYKQASGKFISVWIKLIRYFKTGNNSWKATNRGDLAFPSFVGSGVIEIFDVTNKTKPSISVDVVRESILPRKDEQPSVGQVNNPLGGIRLDGAIVNPLSAVIDSADDDMPF